MRFFALLLVLLLPVAAFSAEPYRIQRVEGAPEWTKVEAVKANGFEFKAVHDAQRVYVAVQWACPVEARSPSPWKWDAVRKLYFPGDEVEDSLEIAWRVPNFSDLWLWRAGRTDPAGFADDLHSTNGFTDFDKGTPCWRQTAPDSFAGEVLPRFLQRTPCGSVGDVAAKGSWREGQWRVVLSRALDTGNADDLAFKKGFQCELGLSSSGRNATFKVVFQ